MSLKYTGYDRLAHRCLAQLDPHAARLTPDQFDLWWRGLSDKERGEIDATLLLRTTRTYMRELYAEATNAKALP